jgi:hypothetical protein
VVNPFSGVVSVTFWDGRPSAMASRAPVRSGARPGLGGNIDHVNSACPRRPFALIWADAHPGSLLAPQHHLAVRAYPVLVMTLAECSTGTLQDVDDPASRL